MKPSSQMLVLRAYFLASGGQRRRGFDRALHPTAPLIDSGRSLPAWTSQRRRGGRSGWASRFAVHHCPSANAAAGSRASGGSTSAGRRLSVISGSWTGDSRRFMRPRFVCQRSLPRACSPCAKILLLIGVVDAQGLLAEGDAGRSSSASTAAAGLPAILMLTLLLIGAHLRTMGVAPCHHHPRVVGPPARQHPAHPIGCAPSRWQLAHPQRSRPSFIRPSATSQRDRTHGGGSSHDEQTRRETDSSGPQCVLGVGLADTSVWNIETQGHCWNSIDPAGCASNPSAPPSPRPMMSSIDLSRNSRNNLEPGQARQPCRTTHGPGRSHGIAAGRTAFPDEERRRLNAAVRFPPPRFPAGRGDSRLKESAAAEGDWEQRRALKPRL